MDFKITVVFAAFLAFTWGYPSSSSERIIGGTEASEGQFPFVVNLLYNGNFGCGGSILTKSTILTAAHCVQGTSPAILDIQAGSTKLGQGVRHKVSRIISHGQYDPETYTNDVALLILSVHLEFTTNIQPIVRENAFLNSGESLITAGWGLTSEAGQRSPTLLYLNVHSVDQQKCRKVMFPFPVTRDQVCAAAKSNAQGLCGGDSGGPLILDEKLVGIVSWGKYGCAKGYPDVYIRVSVFKDWIDSNIQ